MTDLNADPYAAFRINLEQQQKRAKELLKAAKAGASDALQRLAHTGRAETGELKLAHAQHCIARELRFENWAALKRHCTTMAEALSTLGAALDADSRTMHIRCGEDFLRELREAGLHGDFNLQITPYPQGPVTDTPDWLERSARFITDSFGPFMELEYSTVLADSRLELERLSNARHYERVVLWFEHDRLDQFVLLRCLAYFAEHGAPPRLELVTTNDFPGTQPFIGLGQLPPEALKLLWTKRRQISSEQLLFGRLVWDMFRAPDPRPLAALARDGTPLLPDLAAALYRHLQELPAPENGLGLTHRLLLQILAEQGRKTVGRIVGLAMQRDPLPGLGDLGYEQVLHELAGLPDPLVLRTGGHEIHDRFRDEVVLTDMGQAVLRGRVNWLELPVPERWVGGVCIRVGQKNWHWDETARSVMLP
jgi:hypothetical protein